MKKRSSVFALFLTILIMLSAFPVEVSANSPEPAPHYTFYLSNLPAGTAYVDLLICLPETDEMYVDLNYENLPAEFSEDAQILTYCENDYRSYTFHYRDALSSMAPGPDNEVFFFANEEYSFVNYEHGEEIDGRGAVRLAMLDSKGNILKLSPLLNLNEIDKFSYRVNDFYYDASTEYLEIIAIYDNMLDPPGWYIKTRLIGTLASALVEWLVSFGFALKGRRRMIFCTNIVSQLLMHSAYALLYLYSSWSYMTITVVLEILIYLGEFLFYCLRAKAEPRKTWLVYTIVANTTSLISGPVLYLIAAMLFVAVSNIF